MNYNAKRSNRISSLKRKNYKLSSELETYIKDNPQLSRNQRTHLNRLDKNLIACSHESLYSQDLTTDKNIYHASHTCDNKNCSICNYYRQKRIRRKYYRWFKDNRQLAEILTNSGIKVITQSQLSKFNQDPLRMVEYDIMYLTLTLNHTLEHGFNGNHFYFKELIQLFKELRRTKFFVDSVFGGEYGVEITKNLAGLHIHLHSLLFVRKFTQSRNKLHLEIFRYWNKNTFNKYSTRTEFSDEHKIAIKAGNKLIDDEFVNSLNPQAVTLIGLETIYTSSENTKARIKDFNSPLMLKAIMEAISYHFKPQAFDNDNGTYDWNTLSDILPVIYGKRLYDKFGCLRGEKSLNMKAVNIADDLQQDYEDALSVNTDTGEMIQTREYFIANPANVYHFGEVDNLAITLSNKAKKQLRKLKCTTTTQALGVMVQYATKRKRKNIDKYLEDEN